MRGIVYESYPDGKVIADDHSSKAKSMTDNLDDEVNARRSSVQASLRPVVKDVPISTNLENEEGLTKPAVQAALRRVVKPTEAKTDIEGSQTTPEKSPLNVNLPSDVKVRFHAKAFSMPDFKAVFLIHLLRIIPTAFGNRDEGRCREYGF